mgnify:CR=1 FL=1
MTDARDRQIRGLGLINELSREARHAEDVTALGFVAVNDTHALVPYRQALLWASGGRRRARIRAVSGLAVAERDSSFVQWMERIAPHLEKAAEGDAPTAVTAAALPEERRDEWGEWLPAHGLLVPLGAPDGRRLGCLLLVRDTPFADHEAVLLGRLADAYGHAWAALAPGGPAAPRRTPGFLRRWLPAGLARRSDRLPRGTGVLIGLGLLALTAALIPVRLSALAPAEVAARDPWVVRAPLDGVVEEIAVPPNARVAEGDTLVRFDRTRLANELAVARRRAMVATATYRSAGQRAVSDRDEKARLPALKAEMEMERAEARYVADLLARTEVTAERAGVAVYSDPADWNGKPVKTGERILSVADPDRVELEIWLPVEDAIALEAGAPVRLFLAVDPERPLDADVVRAAYEAEVRPSGTVAYRVTARFAEDVAPPRIGLKGTARISGENVSLLYYLLRRPLAAARRWLGV